jgi:hypothetical protein
MKIGNPKIKSHNVQMNRKPIKYLKKIWLQNIFHCKKKFGKQNFKVQKDF